MPPFRKTLSPNAKKVTNAGCKSPNGKKTASPILNQTPPVSNTSSPEDANLHESNAIQTAKKLKRMLESNPAAINGESDGDMHISGKKMKKSHTLVKPIKKQKRALEHDEFIEQTLATSAIESHSGKIDEVVDAKKDESTSNIDMTDGGDHKCKINDEKIVEDKPITWTSDEDRLLLEQIKNGFDFKNDSIMEIAERFPNKTCHHIQERANFLIDFVRNLC